MVGAGLSALLYGMKRVYVTARGVEKIVEFNTEEKHAREALAADLKEHIKMENDRDQIRDHQIIELVDTVREIGREVRPNGGSSMKDVLNNAAVKINEMSTRVAVLEEWKDRRVEERWVNQRPGWKKGDPVE